MVDSRLKTAHTAIDSSIAYRVAGFGRNLQNKRSGLAKSELGRVGQELQVYVRQVSLYRLPDATNNGLPAFRQDPRCIPFVHAVNRCYDKDLMPAVEAQGAMRRCFQRL